MARLSAAVVIPTFERSEFLEPCITSLLDQTRAFEQIIVVDDGSTDATRETLQRFGDALEVLHTPQLGKSGALNFAMPKVHADCVWIFDDDDVAAPDALERFVEPLEHDPQCGFTYSTFWYSPAGPDGELLEPTHASEIPNLEHRGFLPCLLEANFIGGAALFCRSRLYREVGEFSPHLLRSQDYEMAIRIARGYRGLRVRGGPTFHYRQHPGFRGAREDRFAASRSRAKWLEYDQRFFRQLYEELPLGDYLPPDRARATSRRHALLQRAVVMASKDLATEAMRDLRVLATMGEQSRLPGTEQELAARLFRPSWYGRGLLSRREMVRELADLGSRSPVIAQLCALARRQVRLELRECLRARFRQPGGPPEADPLVPTIARLGSRWLALRARRGR